VQIVSRGSGFSAAAVRRAQALAAFGRLPPGGSQRSVQSRRGPLVPCGHTLIVSSVEAPESEPELLPPTGPHAVISATQQPISAKRQMLLTVSLQLRLTG
jgi:hypothetical protein